MTTTDHRRHTSAPDRETLMYPDITCPRCGRVDALQSVPGLYHAGITASSGSQTYSGVGITAGGVIPVFGTTTIDRTHTTALAASLAPAPAPLPVDRLTRRGILWSIPAVFVAIGMVAVLIFGDLDARSAPGGVLFVLLLVWFLSIPGAATLQSAGQRRKRNAVVVRGRAAAHSAWQTAFYCHRCGTVHWPVAPRPTLPAREALAPGVFRSLVWNVGGYAHL
ncbi:hypothetical protein ACTD5D_22410 [Nocardia takedensis]|uniref:hypothetical protein n=1 Tax=Nocardia takedensis TaxID=259390 RepID=UPI003F761722